MATTYYVEATVTATGVLMADVGLSTEQVAHLRAAEANGIITGLIVERDMSAGDVRRAFGGK